MNKVKKVLALILIFILIATMSLFVWPLAVLGQSRANDKNVHLVSPVSIAYGADKLFVADNITDEQSAVHIFDVKTNSPAFETTVDFQKPIVRLRYFNQMLYVLSADSFYILNTTTLSVQTVNQTIRDIAVVENGDAYYLKDGGIFLNSATTVASFADDNNEILCMALNFDAINLLYGTAQRDFFYGMGSTPTQTINGEVEYFGAVTMQSQIIYFNSTSLFFSQQDIIVSDADLTFLDIAVRSNQIFVLNSNNQVYKYMLSSGVYKQVDGFAIGSDVVAITPPLLTDITSFTLAQPLGYPANIIYKTTQEDSIPALLDDTQSHTFIVLGYQGDSNDDYYYVFLNGAFGWVKKSISSTQTIFDDPKIQTTDTSFGGIANFTAKLMSPNAAHIYLLPYDEQDIPQTPDFTISQTSTNLTEVTLHQQFSSVGQIWYLVTFEYQDQNHLGFVKKGDIGYISSAGVIGEPKLVAHKKINATLYENVNVYLTAQLDEQQKTVDPVTQQEIVLATGTLVNVLFEQRKSSYLQIVYADGTTYYGWVDNDFLIDQNALTTNQTVGLIVTSVALVIGVAVIVIFHARRKNLKIPTIDLDMEND